ncbi:unnamed protein product, partial [Laminaria digitata]
PTHPKQECSYQYTLQKRLIPTHKRQKRLILTHNTLNSLAFVFRGATEEKTVYFANVFKTSAGVTIRIPYAQTAVALDRKSLHPRPTHKQKRLIPTHLAPLVCLFFIGRETPPPLITFLKLATGHG